MLTGGREGAGGVEAELSAAAVCTARAVREPSGKSSIRPHTIFVSSYYYICVLILLYMCPHATIFVSSYSYGCVLILLRMCPHTPTDVSSYSYGCVLILLRMCPHTGVSASERAARLGKYAQTSMLTYADKHLSAYVSIRQHTHTGVSASERAARLGKYAQNAGGEAAGTQFTCFTGTNTQFTCFPSRMQEEKQQVLSLLALLLACRRRNSRFSVYLLY